MLFSIHGVLCFFHCRSKMAVLCNLCHRQNWFLLIQEAPLLLLLQSSPVAGAGAAAAAPYRLAFERLEVYYVLSPCHALGIRTHSVRGRLCNSGRLKISRLRFNKILIDHAIFFGKRLGRQTGWTFGRSCSRAHAPRSGHVIPHGPTHRPAFRLIFSAQLMSTNLRRKLHSPSFFHHAHAAAPVESFFSDAITWSCCTGRTPHESHIIVSVCRHDEGESKKLQRELQAMMHRGRHLLKPKLKELRRVGAACGDDADDAGTGRLFCWNGRLEVLQPWQQNAGTNSRGLQQLFFCVNQPLFLLEPLIIFARTSDCHGYEYRCIFFSFLLGLQFFV